MDWIDGVLPRPAGERPVMWLVKSESYRRAALRRSLRKEVTREANTVDAHLRGFILIIDVIFRGLQDVLLLRVRAWRRGMWTMCRNSILCAHETTEKRLFSRRVGSEASSCSISNCSLTLNHWLQSNYLAWLLIENNSKAPLSNISRTAAHLYTLPFKSLGSLRNVFIFQRKALFFQ